MRRFVRSGLPVKKHDVGKIYFKTNAEARCAPSRGGVGPARGFSDAVGEKQARGTVLGDGDARRISLVVDGKK